MTIHLIFDFPQESFFLNLKLLNVFQLIKRIRINILKLFLDQYLYNQILIKSWKS